MWSINQVGQLKMGVNMDELLVLPLLVRNIHSAIAMRLQEP